MEYKEAKALVYRVMSVILSCETLDQLNVACAYANMAYIQIAKTIGMINKVEFLCLIERSIGFAQCKVTTKFDTK